ncbi:MAG: M18 family aminopeptidase [Deltaproteobacteria bacterium]|nr:M18 family aminopeptidase [Deltaproteobacteria bacterium]
MSSPAPVDAADDLLAFLRASPTPWHAVTETVRRLVAAGYRELSEGDAWRIAPGDKVYVIRAGSTILALEIGEASPVTSGIRWIGAHTDSPNLRTKPNADLKRSGQYQLGVEVYGGVLLHTWLDRDLSLAGRVLVRGPEGLVHHLIDAERAIARVPSLAIHLDRNVNTDGLKLNTQTHLPPVLGLESGGAFDLRSFVVAELARTKVEVKPADVLGLDLCFYDAAPPARGGVRGEYVLSGRLDNLASCHAALSAMLAAPPAPQLTRGFVLYDHEECGSQSAQGAQSPFLRDVTARIALAHPKTDADALARTLHASFMISADMAHALHPNYADKHEPQHQPMLGAGPVIKTNNNQRYATDGESAARFEIWCGHAGVTPQKFVTRTDLACGTTIGPITASMAGMRVVDVGNPMLSMHSIREMSAAADVAKMIGAMTSFYAGNDR